MALGFATTLRTSRAAQIKAAIEAAVGAATLKIYTGARPATGAALGAQVLLGTLTFSQPCGTAANGVLSFDPISQDAAADASGTATWFRIEDGDGTFVMDGTITASGAGGDLTLNTTSIVEGGPISVTGVRTITEGNA
jgi:hypothetical protein